MVTNEERFCEICGTVLTYHQKRFCSRKCFIEGISGKNHPHYKPELHGRTCEICGRPLKAHQEKFCSKRCYGNSMTGENNPGYRPELREKICERCGGPLTAIQAIEGNRFCSKRCRMNGENNPRWKGGPASTHCDDCKTPITLERGQFNAYEHHFCTDECYRSWYSKTLSGENSPYWRGGISFEPYGLEFNESLREMIRNRDNRECQYCGIPESELRTKLDTHHLNYNKRDNRESNLISLCKRCHSKTLYRRWYWESYFKMKLLEESSIQSRF